MDKTVLTDEMREKNIMEQLEEVIENICDNFCKYTETCDENAECQWIREGNTCPLDKIS